MTEMQLLKLIGHTDEKDVSAAANPQIEKKAKKKRIPKVWLLAAILAVTIPVTALAVSRYLNLSAYLQENGMEDTSGVEKLAVDVSQEKSFSNELAQYKVVDASCDQNLIYLVAEIRAKDEKNMVIPEYVMPYESIQVLNMEGVTEGSVQDYADAHGKTLIYGSFRFQNEEIPGPETEDVRFTSDGTMYCYITAPNGTGKEDLTLHCSGRAWPMDDAAGDQMVCAEYDFKIQDRSSAKELVFKNFDEKMAEEIHITPLELKLTETEMGTQVTFTYKGDPDRANNSHLFMLVDKNGEDLPWMPASSGETKILEDGTYEVSYVIQSVDSLDGVKMQFPHHEPYSFSK